MITCLSSVFYFTYFMREIAAFTNIYKFVGFSTSVVFLHESQHYYFHLLFSLVLYIECPLDKAFFLTISQLSSCFFTWDFCPFSSLYWFIDISIFAKIGIFLNFLIKAPYATLADFLTSFFLDYYFFLGAGTVF